MKQFANPRHFKQHAQFLQCRDGYFIFVHVPKAAGSTIEQCLSKFARRKLSGHTPLSEFERQLPDNSKKLSFAIVRNPLTRAASAYKYLSAQSRDRWHKPYWEAVGAPKSFEEFCEGLLRLHESRGISHVVPHLVPQHELLSLEGGIAVDHILKMETLSTDMRQMLATMGGGWLSGSQKSNLQAATHRKTNQSGSHAVKQTERTKEIIRIVYQRDFELFYPDA